MCLVPAFVSLSCSSEAVNGQFGTPALWQQVFANDSRGQPIFLSDLPSSRNASEHDSGKDG